MSLLQSQLKSEFTPELVPIYESTSEPTQVYESTPEPTQVYESTPEPTQVYESTPDPPEVVASAAEPPMAAVPTSVHLWVVTPTPELSVCSVMAKETVELSACPVLVKETIAELSVHPVAADEAVIKLFGLFFAVMMVLFGGLSVGLRWLSASPILFPGPLVLPAPPWPPAPALLAHHPSP